MAEPLKPPKGGFLRPFGCGEFIRDYLMGLGPYGSAMIDPKLGAPIEDIRAAYNDALLRSHAEDMIAIALGKGIDLSMKEALRRIPSRLSRARSHSFYRYFHNLKMLKWVELTGQEEGSLLGGLPWAKVQRTSTGTTLVEVPQPRRFYRITSKGKQASAADWSDPLQAVYHCPREYRSGTKANRIARPGSLPHKSRTRS